jgi:hypothetical protein
VFPGLARRVSCPVQNRNAGLGDVHHSSLLDQRGNASQFRQGALALGQVVHGQHRVRLATTEGGLQLDDRLAPLPTSR